MKWFTILSILTCLQLPLSALEGVNGVPQKSSLFSKSRIYANQKQKTPRDPLIPRDKAHLQNVPVMIAEAMNESPLRCHELKKK